MLDTHASPTMRRDRSVVRRAVLVGALALLGFPRVAAAGLWYYNWSCSGDCAGGRLAIDGREGPFASRDDCNYARDRDTRSDSFVSPGNLGGLDFCYEVAGPTPAIGVPGYAVDQPPNKTRLSQIEVGVSVGPGWQATGDDGTTSRGAATLGIEVDTHTGRDGGGGSVQIGLLATWLEAPMLGPDSHAYLVVPVSVGLGLTPKLASGKAWSVRADLGASAGGFFQLDCSNCSGAVFDETLAFGYTLKAGLDVYLSKNNGYSLDVIFPRWQIGAAGPGNLLLESPAWMVRLSRISRPERE